MLDDQMSLEDMERAALAAITELILQGRMILVSYSGGKDSTTVLLLALNAARSLAEQGIKFPPLVVTNADTDIENPQVVGLVRQELAKARAYGEKHGFEVKTEVTHPSLNDSWAVSILSGRKLPTFANNSRDCTISYKVRPMALFRNKLLGRTKGKPDQPVTLTGTRFEESTGRATRMNERGETAYVPWEKGGDLFMSPIANWDMTDVWAYLAQFRDGKKEGFTNAKDIFEIYASATDDNTCAVVGDIASEGHKKGRACGARFGCGVCAAVGRDKSLEAMLNHEENAWMRPLNTIQRFIVDTQHDWSRRNWLGRTLTDGYIKIVPDTYSPAMLAELLRYCLSVDADEQQRARRLGIAPGFRLVTDEQLLAIDALWSLNGIQEKPFAALQIWHDVYVKHERYYPPEIEPVRETPMPTARYLYVGPSWDADRPWTFNGFRDIKNEAFGDGRTRLLEDGRRVAAFEQSPRIAVDKESLCMFLDFEAEDCLREAKESSYAAPTDAWYKYIRYGVFSTSTTHVSVDVDNIVRRTNWRIRQGLVGPVDVDKLLKRTVSRKEMIADIAERKGVDPEAAYQADLAAEARKQIEKANKGRSKEEKPPKPPKEKEPTPQMALWDVGMAAAILPAETVRALSTIRTPAKAAQQTTTSAPSSTVAPQLSLWDDAQATPPAMSWNETRNRFSALVENVSLKGQDATAHAVEEDDSRQENSVTRRGPP